LGHVVVGKTTPPFDVVNFQAARRADGVQLSWDPVSELDVVGYEVRDGESWDAGVVVTTRHRGTTLFVTLVDADDHRFHIRAIDEMGLRSVSAVSVVASVVPPADVTGFDAVPQGEHVRFSWTSLPIAGVEYEIRAGESWGQGRFVGRSAGDHLVSLWPVQTAADETFWCKAVSAAGLYSQTAAFATTRLAQPAEPPICRILPFGEDRLERQRSRGRRKQEVLRHNPLLNAASNMLLICSNPQRAQHQAQSPHRSTKSTT